MLVRRIAATVCVGLALTLAGAGSALGAPSNPPPGDPGNHCKLVGCHGCSGHFDPSLCS